MTDTQQKGIGAIVVVLIIAAVVIVGGLAFYAFKGKTQNETPKTEVLENVSPTTATNGGSMTNETSTPAATNVLTNDKSEVAITVTGQNFTFSPSTITVKKGQKVTLQFKSAGGFHNFVIDELDVKTEVLGSGKSQTVTFTPTKTGTFEYYCSIGNHRAMGMVGTLIVQ